MAEQQSLAQKKKIQPNQASPPPSPSTPNQRMCGTTWVEMLGTTECPCGHSVVQVRSESQCAIGIMQGGGDLSSRMFCWEEPQGIVKVEGEFCAACRFRLNKTGTTETNDEVVSEEIVATRESL